jgi:hypothetical protein
VGSPVGGARHIRGQEAPGSAPRYAEATVCRRADTTTTTSAPAWRHVTSAWPHRQPPALRRRRSRPARILAPDPVPPRRAGHREGAGCDVRRMPLDAPRPAPWTSDLIPLVLSRRALFRRASDPTRGSRPTGLRPPVGLPTIAGRTAAPAQMHRRSGVPPGRPARVGLPPHGLVSVGRRGMARQPSATANWTRAPSSTRRPRPGPVSVWATEGRIPRSKRSPLSSPGRQIVGPPSTKRVVARDRAPARTRLTRPVEGSVAIRTKSLRAPAAGVSGPAPSATSSIEEQKVVIRSGITLETPHEFHQAAQSPDLGPGMITAPTVEERIEG